MTEQERLLESRRRRIARGAADEGRRAAALHEYALIHGGGMVFAVRGADAVAMLNEVIVERIPGLPPEIPGAVVWKRQSFACIDPFQLAGFKATRPQTALLLGSCRAGQIALGGERIEITARPADQELDPAPPHAAWRAWTRGRDANGCWHIDAQALTEFVSGLPCFADRQGAG